MNYVWNTIHVFIVWNGLESAILHKSLNLSFSICLQKSVPGNSSPHLENRVEKSHLATKRLLSTVNFCQRWLWGRKHFVHFLTYLSGYQLLNLSMFSQPKWRHFRNCCRQRASLFLTIWLSASFGEFYFVIYPMTFV